MIADDLQYSQSKKPIEYSKLLLVEGRDAHSFFKALLKELDLLSTIEIRNFGGIKELPKYLKVLPATPGFPRVISLGIVRDAEENSDAAFQSVRGALKKANLPVPKKTSQLTDTNPQISLFVMPDNEASGMLETVCLQSVQDDPAIDCIDKYFECISQKIDNTLNMPKARVQAFLASRKQPGLKLGEAAHKGYWQWDNPAFNSIKQFLLAL